jgi:membrane-bound ClpP family serine protease
MGIGVSTLLIAVGAILRFAVNVVVTGINLGVVGIILMIVGAIGLLLSLVLFGPWSSRSHRRTVVEDNRGNQQIIEEDRTLS